VHVVLGNDSLRKRGVVPGQFQPGRRVPAVPDAFREPEQAADGSECPALGDGRQPRPAGNWEVAALPLEKRYIWRVASALKWAFADFENPSVVADRRTLGQEDLDKLVDLLRVRPIQFCMFLAALFGEERMEKLISSSVQQVKALRANRRKSLGRDPELEEEVG
jgi:hypothetical protein